MRRRPLLAALVAGFAWVATGFRPFTLPALAAVLGGGVAAILLGRRRRIYRAASGTEPVRGAWVWAVLTGATGLWQLQAFVQHPRRDHPTLSSLTNDLLQNHVPRAVAMVAWLAGGIWLARR